MLSVKIQSQLLDRVFFWGYAGLIDNIINLIKKETRKSFKVIITGGFSELFINSIKTKVNHNKILLLTDL